MSSFSSASSCYIGQLSVSSQTRARTRKRHPVVAAAAAAAASSPSASGPEASSRAVAASGCSCQVRVDQLSEGTSTAMRKMKNKTYTVKQTNKQTYRRTSTTSSEASNPSHENAKPPGHRGRQLSHLRRLDKPCEHRRRDHSFLSSRSPKTNTKKRSKSSHKHTVPLTMYYVVLSLSSQLAT